LKTLDPVEPMEVTIVSQSYKILRRPDVEAATGLKRSMIYLLVSRGEFPRPVKLSVRAVGWRDTDVAAWIASRQTV
jgi:prophage regulatory protein